MVVKVVVRLRPLLPREECKNATLCLKMEDILDSNHSSVSSNVSSKRLLLSHPRGDITSSLSETYRYHFDHCYPSDVTQSQFFHSEIIQELGQLFHGIHTTIFAYGATGTGMT